MSTVDTTELGRGDAAWQRDLPDFGRLVFPIRHIAIVLCAACSVVVTSLGPTRWWLACLAVVVLLPTDLVFARYTRRHGNFPVVMPFANELYAGLAVVIEPRAFVPIVVLLVADTTFAAVAFPRPVVIAAAVNGLTMILVAAHIAEVADPVPAVLGLAIADLTVVFIIGALTDAERSLRRLYGTLVGGVDVVVWEMVPGSNRFTYVSPGAERVLGYTIDEWLEPGFWSTHIHLDDRDRILAEYDEAIAAGVDHVLEYRMVASNGDQVHLRDVANVECDSAGHAVKMRGVMMDVSDRRRAEEQLRLQATHDALTGLPNRALLADRLEQAVLESRRTGAPIALLLLDLDQFKEVNDALGHWAGDQLLVAFAERLQRDLRDSDTIARLGGDEFAVLLTTTADRLGAVSVADRVLAALDVPFEINDLSLRTGASIGVALFPDHAQDAATLVARADVAMYLAKRSGHGYAVYEPELDQSSVARLTLLGQLPRAIETDELSLDYQLCFDLRTGRARSAEALVRWDHAVLGRVMPADFIRLAEVSGFIRPLTRWVLEHAVVEHAAAGLDLDVSINLSLRNLAEPDLAGWLGVMLRRHGFDPARLILELTESEMVGDIDIAGDVLRHLRGLGVKIAIDDFGGGQSALTYLRSLPVDELKIDRRFVGGAATNATDATICRSIVELGHGLGLRVTALGVADAQTLDTLTTIGCDRAQGFHLAEPVAIDALATLVHNTLTAPSANDPFHGG